MNTYLAHPSYLYLQHILTLQQPPHHPILLPSLILPLVSWSSLPHWSQSFFIASYLYHFSIFIASTPERHSWVQLSRLKGNFSSFSLLLLPLPLLLPVLTKWIGRTHSKLWDHEPLRYGLETEFTSHSNLDLLAMMTKTTSKPVTTPNLLPRYSSIIVH